MDHNQALRSQACEKYLLGELSPELRDAFEEHYFSCSDCALQLRSSAELLAASREIFAEAPATVAAPQPAPVAPASPAYWLRWLKPAFVVPAFAALLLLIGYQNFVAIPHWKHAAEPRVLPMFSLISAGARGDEGLVFSVAPDQPFGLYVDVPADPAYSTYLLRLQDPSGSSTPLRSLTAADAQKTQVITVNPGKRAGKYTIVVSGLASPSAVASSAKELARLQFTVEFIN